MTTTLLDISQLRAGYGKAEVLSGLALTAAKGTIVSVLGPNGAGKSTLLNSLSGVIGSHGVQRFEGEDISRLSLEQRVMRGISLVPEKRELFTTMTVEENLLLGGHRPRELRFAAWRDTTDLVYGLFPRLKERRKQFAGTLSGGERQMLAVGRALMGQPKLLMLDEPSLGLAPLIVAEMMKAINKLKEAGLTVLLVEQNARAALEISDWAYVLEGGAFLMQGSAQEMRSDPRLIESYLGTRKAG
jgi:branched-chain amino acid transport system ATP-binding protein